MGNPHQVGLCQNDVAEACRVLYGAQQRLIYAKETGDSGWTGAWAEVLFNVNVADPFITLPRGISRIEWAVGCDRPLSQQNQFYEYLTFGVGRTPEPSETNGSCCASHPGTFCNGSRIQDKGWVATQSPVQAGSLLRFYITDVSDVTKRALVSGTDTNNLTISGTDSGVLVQGEFVAFASPLATTISTWNTITGLQKDVTTGFIAVYAVDSAGDETLVAMLEPTERVASYRRYYLTNLPASCCASDGTGTLPVRALVKLDLLPLQADTDYLIIQNIAALDAEIQAGRLAAADGMANKAEARERHNAAIGLLQGELVHAFGKDQLAVDWAPFGTARLSRLNLGMR